MNLYKENLENLAIVENHKTKAKKLKGWFDNTLAKMELESQSLPVRDLKVMINQTYQEFHSQICMLNQQTLKRLEETKEDKTKGLLLSLERDLYC